MELSKIAVVSQAHGQDRWDPSWDQLTSNSSIYFTVRWFCWCSHHLHCLCGASYSDEQASRTFRAHDMLNFCQYRKIVFFSTLTVYSGNISTLQIIKPGSSLQMYCENRLQHIGAAVQMQYTRVFLFNKYDDLGTGNSCSTFVFDFPFSKLSNQ